MKTTITLLRTGSAFAAAGLLVGMLSACAPESEPTPKPTTSAAFATDEEAFAAAEATYQAYTDAMNKVDLADPATFESLYAYSTGGFETADRETFSQLHAEGLRMSGQVVLVKFRGKDFDAKTARVEADVCIDVSRSDVVDSSGNSRVAPDRSDMNPLHVDFEAQGDAMLISRAERDENIKCDAA
ncbi:hypothetical protein [Microbacterium esteraromaticum]|uniref:hypothetical protein n=1 Tax=Microbacterium esteraromaticum TaxID=57043 RepID=UPI00195717B2|nr:hypothetical protein [Microbacterium esteraromaticum]MBM7466977.1 hypothetical protein [Microbacterium esteraromaticum]